MDGLNLPTIPSFGKEIRETLFFLDKEAAFTNHGSFGTVPRPIFHAQNELRMEMDVNPDAWFRRKYRQKYIRSCEEIANFIGAPSESVVLVNNATTAVNVVLNSFSLSPGDGVLITNLTYGACRNTAQVVCERTGAELLSMELHLPLDKKEDVVELYRRYLEEHSNIRFALIDHITSPSTVVLPVKEITAVCHSRGVRVMVDGAHAPGQLELKVQDIGADYYTGNLHKWLFCPRGCALLYVKEEFQPTVYPVVVSHTHFDPFKYRFIFTGTDDHTPYCMVPAALEFFSRIGGLEAISSYNKSLLSWATDLLCQRWGVKPLPIPQEMFPPFLSVLGPLPSTLAEATIEGKEKLQERLYREYNVIAVFDVVEGQLWCRICAQVYNTKEDYQKLADAVVELSANASQ